MLAVVTQSSGFKSTVLSPNIIERNYATHNIFIYLLLSFGASSSHVFVAAAFVTDIDGRCFVFIRLEVIRGGDVNLGSFGIVHHVANQEEPNESK